MPFTKKALFAPLSSGFILIKLDLNLAPIA